MTGGTLGFDPWQPGGEGEPLPPPPYPLWRVLFCAGCGEQFFGAHQFSGLRVYCTSCSCRTRSVPADEVEKRAYAEVHALVFGDDEVTGLTKVHYGRLAVRIFSRVEVGQTAEDLTFTTRPLPGPLYKETNR